MIRGLPVGDARQSSARLVGIERIGVALCPKRHRKGTRFVKKRVTATGARAARRLDHLVPGITKK